jgi:hypothetical protein
MADRDVWEKAESLSKIFAAAAIPFLLGIATLVANQTLEKSKNREELLKQAIEVVFLSKSDQMAGADKSFESRRAHRSYWLEIYNRLADVKLSNDFIAVMMEQETLGRTGPHFIGQEICRVLFQIMKDLGPRARMRMNWVTVG